MTPLENIDDVVVKEPSQTPWYTYKMNYSEGTCIGYVDELEAMRQAIYKVIYTERGKYPIYSWNYGIELEDLFGQQKTLVVTKLETRFREALLVDDRILSLDNFTFDMHSNANYITVEFNCTTVYGDVEITKEVYVNE